MGGREGGKGHTCDSSCIAIPSNRSEAAVCLKHLNENC